MKPARKNEVIDVALSSLEYGRQVLHTEAEAIQKLADSLDASFNQAVETILAISSKGHVVVSGIGKAGFIGMKISATLASTGIPSFFLHPAEALHGDLGRYTKNDLALILSNSGKTEEVLRTIPQIRRTGCKIISMTGEPEALLAKHSDIALNIGKITEAGPLSLAPTTSTSVMLALGDALAMSVLAKRGFSKEEFAVYHPAGNLGRSLMPVSEIMRKDDEHCIILETMKARLAVRQITATKGRPGAASIINEEGALVGIFTDGNLRRCLDQEIDFLELPISRVMTKNPKTMRANQSAAEALTTLSRNKIDQVIVVDSKNQPIGMIDIQDLLEVSPA